MTTASEELDFRLIFGEGCQQPPLGPADLEPDDSQSFYILDVGQPQSVVYQPIGLIPRYGLQAHAPLVSVPSSRFQAHRAYDPSLQAHRAYDPSLQAHRAYDPSLQPPGSRPSLPAGRPAFDCPSIQITSTPPSCPQQTGAAEDGPRATGPDGDHHLDRPPSRGQLYLPLEPPSRDASLSPSPCSSLSSRSWFSDGSSCESLSLIYDDDIDPELSEATARFSLVSSPSGDEPWPRPRRPPRPSPSRSPTPVLQAPPPRAAPPAPRRGGTPLLPGTASPRKRGPAAPGPFHCCPPEVDVPLKTRKTSRDRTGALSGKGDLGLEDPGTIGPSPDPPDERDGPAEQFLSVPSPFTWAKPKPGHASVFRTSSLPPLDWPLPSQSGPHQLQIEVQPRTHHRAHYETEGSRGALRAAAGGHPVVKLIGYSDKPLNLQMFIGTADDRYLRPHAFYQVHRITGKTVGTPSQEVIIAGTKVLEIPLLPENSMSASIDCAGILKLRNSDIELRKGETDVGRKNTRVRVVFRVHIPQPGGNVLSLQTASVPVECSQRCAQELPLVDRFTPPSCSVTGGEEMIITGSNFSPESKVLFQEKGSDGRPLWEVNAKIIREKSQGVNIVLTVPPYRSEAGTSPVQVLFYVCNGKRKRSQSQRFTYLPVVVKQEQRDEQDVAPPPHLPPPDPGPPQGPVPGRPRPRPAYSPASPSSFPHQLIGQAPAFGPAPALPPPTHPPSSCQPVQHNLLYNQPCLPMSPQGYERLPYLLDPTSSHLEYRPLPWLRPHSTVSQSLAHAPPHLRSLGYHCHPPPAPPLLLSDAQPPCAPGLAPHGPPRPPPRGPLLVKQEPEDQDAPFPPIGLQDITLDDVNEVIGRDLSRVPGLQS
ncbi:hypothetical protein AAFF_G00429320 [Aldrovandia affinis]|uniref:RHD domain-containing protein n=1 Tax=Aldrovandia affinis TaxID=143900 RepID=A0AAD7S9S2_9TELE|nr:hypothetical protein AAFF_G00429320 [Aldrovandia affinis]